MCVHLVTKCQAIDDPISAPCTQESFLYNLGSSITLILLQYQQHQPFNTPLFLGFLVPPFCLNSGSVDVAFRFREERWHGASVSLPCENDDGDNRAATCASVASFSSITLLSTGVILVCCVFRHVCTATVSPGFRSARDTKETSQSFTLTIDCASCQNMRWSNLVSNPFYQNSSCGLFAMLHFTSPQCW